MLIVRASAASPKALVFDDPGLLCWFAVGPEGEQRALGLVAPVETVELVLAGLHSHAIPLTLEVRVRVFGLGVGVLLFGRYAVGDVIDVLDELDGAGPEVASKRLAKRWPWPHLLLARDDRRTLALRVLDGLGLPYTVAR